MNSRQRRVHRRRFRHMVNVNDIDPGNTQMLYDMLYWCDSRYGYKGYAYRWWQDDGPTFGFASRERAIEFRLVWS